MKENKKILVGVIIGIIGVVIVLFLYTNKTNGGVTQKQLQETVNGIIEPFKNEVNKNFYIQGLQIDTLKSNQTIIIDKINEIIILQNRTIDTLNRVNYKTDWLLYGNNAIYKEITGVNLPEFDK